MPTFGAWEYEVLEHTFDVADFLSMHMYYENPHNEVQEFLANIELMDRFTKEAVAVCDAVAAKRRSTRRIMLSFDEWNVCYKARSGEDMAKPVLEKLRICLAWMRPRCSGRGLLRCDKPRTLRGVSAKTSSPGTETVWTANSRKAW